MARRPRISLAGYHHVINRGVAKKHLLASDDDKDKFLQILCKCAKDYSFYLHSFCIMDNHYHLLIETTRENISHAIRTINSNYATYYNKKYKRSGHLWQGRYKSSYITNEEYLFTLIRYIEQNPIKADIVKNLKTYPYCSYYHFLKDEVNECLKYSIIYDRFSTKKEIVEFLDQDIEETDMYQLNKELKKPSNTTIDTESLNDKEIPLEQILKDISKMNMKDRNDKIIKAYKEGYSQNLIAKTIGMAQSNVFKIIHK